MSLKRFGVSLEDHLLESLDCYVASNGFCNRSQALRFMVEKTIAEEKWLCNHTVAGTINVMYDPARKDITAHLADICQQYQKLILSATQYFLHAESCLQVTTVMGRANELTKLADVMKSIKGIKHAKLVMSRAE